MKKFYIVHSGVQHVIQSVIAFQENKLLEKFYTSFILADQDYKWLNRIPNDQLRKFLSLRRSSKINSNKISNIPYLEAIEIASKIILGKNTFTINTLPHWRDKMFAKRTANLVETECMGVFGFPNNVLESFKQISSNSLKILEQPIGYNRAARDIFEKEKQLHPKFSDSITFNDNSTAYLDRIDEELKLADIICVPSKFVKKTLVDYGFDQHKIELNPYGTFLEPLNKFKYNSDKPLVLLFVGQISQRKGIKYLLDAVKLLKKENIDVKLILVGQIYGKGNWKKKYEHIIDEYYASIPRDELKIIYQKSDVFILPSLFEGSALVTYEALAHGLPCIVTPNTGADAVKDNFNGYIVPIRNIEKIKKHIIKLHQDRELLHHLKNNALNSSKSLKWKFYRNRLYRIVKNEL